MAARKKTETTDRDATAPAENWQVAYTFTGHPLSRITLRTPLDSDTERMLGLQLTGSRTVRAGVDRVARIEMIAPLVVRITSTDGRSCVAAIDLGIE